MSTNERNEPAMEHQRLCAYVFGELDASERAAFEAELERDPALRAEHERLVATVGLVRDALPTEELSGATRDVLAKAATTPPAPSGFLLLRGGAPRFAAAAIVLVATALGIRSLVVGSSHRPEHASEVAHLDAPYGGDVEDEARRAASSADELATHERLREIGYGDAGRPETEFEVAAGLEAPPERPFPPKDASAPTTDARRLQAEGAPGAPVQDDPAWSNGVFGKSAPGEEADLDAAGRASLAALGYTGAEAADGYTGGYAGPGDSAPAGEPVVEESLLAQGLEVKLVPDATAQPQPVTGGGFVGVATTPGANPAPPASAGPSTPGPAGPGAPGGGGSPFDSKSTTSTLGIGGGGGGSYGSHGGKMPKAKAPSPAVAGEPALREYVAEDEPEVEIGFRYDSDYVAGDTLGEHVRRVLVDSLDLADGDDGVRFERGRRSEDAEDLKRLRLDELEERRKGGRYFDDGEASYHLGRPATAADLDRACESVYRFCRRRPHETPSMMFFRYWGDNPFELAAVDNVSTFSVDVDTASYALARRYLREGRVPTKAQIRTEEFVNYFDADVPAPLESTFDVHTDLAPSLFGGGDPSKWMVRVVVRGKEVDKFERRPLALTFVVDVSGSMKENNRLELVKHSLRLLVGEMSVSDSIAIVAFSNEARLVLPMTQAGSRGAIEAAIYGLQPDGGTNAEAGLRLGYGLASDALTPGANNRVVLLSDGVANIGQTDQDRIANDIAAQRKRGIYLNTIGVGMGNHNDVFLEQLANKGDGLCNYIDSPKEAQRALVENFTGAFEPIARDVKIQVEFDPAQVESYRRLGYENRAIADADFRNDAVDAGEVNAGHQVTALFEITRWNVGGNVLSESPLATVRVRYKQPYSVSDVGKSLGTLASEDRLGDPERAREIEHRLFAGQAQTMWQGTPLGFRRAVLVAQVAEVLRRSVHARGESFDTLLGTMLKLDAELSDPDFSELCMLLRDRRDLIVGQLSREDDFTRTVDELCRNRYLTAKYEDLRTESLADQLRQLEQQNADLEAKIREILRQRLGVQEPR